MLTAGRYSPFCDLPPNSSSCFFCVVVKSSTIVYDALSDTISTADFDHGRLVRLHVAPTAFT